MTNKNTEQKNSTQFFKDLKKVALIWVFAHKSGMYFCVTKKEIHFKAQDTEIKYRIIKDELYNRFIMIID